MIAGWCVAQPAEGAAAWRVHRSDILKTAPKPLFILRSAIKLMFVFISIVSLDNAYSNYFATRSLLY